MAVLNIDATAYAVSLPTDTDSSTTDPEIGHKRHLNDLRLKNTFERIFLKYSQDFSEVGDEVDLQTGQIVVDNGHICRMQNERDVGSKDTARPWRSTATEEGHISDIEEDELAAGHIETFDVVKRLPAVRKVRNGPLCRVGLND